LSVPRGVALTDVTGDGHGIWQYSANGTHWSAVGLVDDDAALLLPSTYRLRFVPAADFNGQVGLTYRAWDQTTGSAGGRAGASAPGGGAAFSVAAEEATLTVPPANDRPTATPAYAPGQVRVAAGPTGTVVAELLTGWVTDADGDVPGIAVTGASAPGGRW